jgi:hypothetical protein
VFFCAPEIRAEIAPAANPRHAVYRALACRILKYFSSPILILFFKLFL